MMDKGNKVFPNEGIDEALPILNKIKNSMIFSENDLKYAYESIGHLSYEKIEYFKTI